MPERAIVMAIEAQSLSSTAAYECMRRHTESGLFAQPDDSSDGRVVKLRQNRLTTRQTDDNSPISVIIDNDAPEASTRFSV